MNVVSTRLDKRIPEKYLVWVLGDSLSIFGRYKNRTWGTNRAQSCATWQIGRGSGCGTRRSTRRGGAPRGSALSGAHASVKSAKS